jgi:WD40 repeat protein
MNDLELRQQFEDWAAPLRTAAPPPLTALRKRIRRRRTRLAAATGSALAVAGLAVGVAIAGLVAPWYRSSAGPWGTSAFPAPRGAPFLVILDSRTGAARLLDEATGTVLRTIRPARGTFFTWVAATPNDRVFVLAEQRTTSVTRWSDSSFQTSFVKLRINDRGQPVVGKPASAPLAALISAMAVSPDGSRVAVTTIQPNNPTQSAQSIVRVFDLAAGPTSPLAGDWVSRTGIVFQLSWHGASQLYLGWLSRAHWAGGLQVLDVRTGHGSAPQSLASHSVLPLSPSLTYYATVTADGTVALLLTNSHQAAMLDEIAIGSGKTLAAIPIGSSNARHTSLTSKHYCGVLWVNQDGSRLITQCGTRQVLVVNGRASVTRLAVLLPIPPQNWANSFAW